jgi:hypothetical protein
VKGDRIRYRSGFKYVLLDDYALYLQHVRPEQDIVTEYVTLSRSGRLWIRHGYAWDGPSGPTCDSHDSMRGSLVHDALYQLIREGLLDRDVHRDPADRELRDICVEDGMSAFRAGLWFDAVRKFGQKAACGDGGRPAQSAP